LTGSASGPEGAIVASFRNGEVLHELEDEYEIEGEDFLEGEDEAFFGAIAQGLGSLLGGQGEIEGEEEYGLAHEMHEHEFEDEYEHGFGEYEDEYEHGFGEFEDEGELFFGGLKRFLRRAAPILKSVAQVAAPLVGTAVGGPLGGVLGRAAASALGEGELEGYGEYEDEFEDEFEGEAEAEYEAHFAAPVTESEAMAELMASVAAGAQTEAEAEAMIGAATINTLSARERRELQRVLAHLVRGSAVLTRILRRRRITRPCVRTVPLIVHSTARTLGRYAATGRPITRQTAGRIMAAHTRRVLSNPRIVGMAVRRNARATQQARRHARVTIAAPRRHHAVARRRPY
jgi:hypothetical protein